MLKKIWQHILTISLCNSLLLFSIQANVLDPINNQIEKLEAEMNAMVPGTASYDQAKHNQLVENIRLLKIRQTTLSTQANTLNELQNKLDNTNKDSPEYQLLVEQVLAATKNQQDTLNQIAEDSKKMAKQSISNTESAMIDGLNGEAASVEIINSKSKITDAIDLQNEAIKFGHKIKGLKLQLMAPLQARVNAEFLDMKSHPAEKCTGTEIIPNPHYNINCASMDDTHSCTSKTITRHFCTPDDFKKVEDQSGLTAKKAEIAAIDKEILGFNAELERLKGLQEKLDIAAEDNKNNVNQKMKAKISQSLGHDRIKVAVEDMTRTVFSNSSETKIASEKVQSAMEADITMVILGTVTTRLMKCSARDPNYKVADLLIAATAGEAFVAGEVAEYAVLNALNTQLQSQMKEIYGDPNDKQIEALRKLLNLYKEVRTAAANKRDLRNSSLDTYFSAATVAATEATTLAEASSACSSGISSKVGKGTSSASMYGMIGSLGCSMYYGCLAMCSGTCGCTLPHVGPVNACSAISLAGSIAKNMCSSGGSSSVSANQSRQEACEDRQGNKHIHEDTTQRPTANKTISENITKECWAKGGYQNIQAPANDGCGAIPIFAAPGKGPYDGCQQADDLFDKYNVWCPINALNGSLDPHFVHKKNYFEIVTDILFPKAHAGMLTAMGIGKEKVVNFIKEQSPIFANALDTQLAAPLWRSIAWTALGSLVNESIHSTDYMIQEIDKNIIIVQNILDAALKQMKDGALGNRVAPGTPDVVSPFMRSFDALPTIVSTANGNKLDLHKGAVTANMPATLEIPLATQEIIKPTLLLGDKLSGATYLNNEILVSIKNLNNKSAAIKAEMNKRQAGLQKMLARQGIKIDIVHESSLLSDSFKNMTRAGLKENKIDALSLKSLIGKNESLSVSLDKDQKNLNAKEHKIPVIDFHLHNLEKYKVKYNDKIDSKEIHNGEAAISDPNAITDNEYTTNTSEKENSNKPTGKIINEAEGDSLFELINTRYRKSAFPKLFKKQ